MTVDLQLLCSHVYCLGVEMQKCSHICTQINAKNKKLFVVYLVSWNFAKHTYYLEDDFFGR